ncbi:MAG: formate dehydrogenase [Proteobacteria bacterium]|nr:formate dehydrogenase [Pseudomonadota bacterium]
MSRNIRALSRQTGLQQNLFTAIQDSAGNKGSPDSTDLTALAEQWRIGEAASYATASFYDFLHSDNKGKREWVCKGTACLMNGSSESAAAQCDNHGDALCLGYCYQGGGLLRQDNEGKFQTRALSGDSFQAVTMPVYSFCDTAVLTSTVDHVEALYRVALDCSDAQQQLRLSGLRGRGGAGFPFALKVQACAAEESVEKYIVCNADEGDPGAFSDRYLLEEQAHKVMAGMYAAGIACGAAQGVLYIRREYPEAITIIARAIEYYQDLPADISDKFSFYIIPGAGSYVCGEETALLNSIEGQRPEVRTRPPYPASYGLWGKPTLVSNVETFATVPWILQHGGAAYSSIGTQKSTGTKLLSLDAQFVRPGLYEVDMGADLETLVLEHAGGFKAPVKALQLGGPLGCIIPINKLAGLKLDFESMQQSGFALGHAGIVAIPQSFPIRDFLEHLFSYMAHESCGKCSPCRLGTAQGARLLEAAGQGEKIDSKLFADLLDTLEFGSLCALGGGLPLPVRNCLEYFQTELAGYFSTGESA